MTADVLRLRTKFHYYPVMSELIGGIRIKTVALKWVFRQKDIKKLLEGISKENHPVQK